MNAQKFRVVDGQYSSDLFDTIEEARADVETCKADEGFSGSVRIEHYDVGSGGGGEVIEVYGTEGPNVLSKGATVHSIAAAEWCQEESRKYLESQAEAGATWPDVDSES